MGFKLINALIKHHLTVKYHETKQDFLDFPHVCFHRGGQHGIDAQLHKLTTRGH